MSDTRTELLAESSADLVQVMRGEIEREGRITFARFMELALTHPEHGYYMNRDPRAGFAGDFLTGPETHRIFGWALARQVAECWDRLDRSAPFTVREAGAGTGTLARDIIDGLRQERPEILDALRYELGDVNPSRIDQAMRRLVETGAGDIAARATDAPITGVLLANELLDAFPVHRLIVSDGEPGEMYVVWRDGWFADEIGPVSDPDLVATLAGLELTEGQRLEVSPDAQAWARGIGEQIERGYAILIDYGYPAGQLYSPVERPEGTLRTYSRHLAGDDPYRRVGLQDLTAHVNFSAVAAAAEAGGCEVLGLSSQAYFFAGLGIEELLLKLQQQSVDSNDYLNARETIMHLLEPHGLGRFRVLVLGKHVPDQPPLRGLSFVLA